MQKLSELWDPQLFMGYASGYRTIFWRIFWIRGTISLNARDWKFWKKYPWQYMISGNRKWGFKGISLLGIGFSFTWKKDPILVKFYGKRSQIREEQEQCIS